MIETVVWFPESTLKEVSDFSETSLYMYYCHSLIFF